MHKLETIFGSVAAFKISVSKRPLQCCRRLRQVDAGVKPAALKTAQEEKIVLL